MMVDSGSVDSVSTLQPIEQDKLVQERLNLASEHVRNDGHLSPLIENIEEEQEMWHTTY